jgi:hypothetical protein
MTTDEFKTLLDRTGALQESQPLIELTCPLLRETVNKATWVFDSCFNSEDSQVGGVNEDVAAMTLFRHMIELIDGVEVLFSANCVGASAPLLRAAFEASLSLDYIFQTDYTRRSLCWTCGYLHDRIGSQQLIDSSTDVGREFRRAREQMGAYEPSTYNSGPDVERLKLVLATPSLAPIEVEYQRVRRLRKRRPHWFQLFDGPRDRRALASMVGREAEYLSFYREWSAFSHATDARPYLRPGNLPGRPAFVALRHPGEMQYGASMALSCILKAMRLTIAHFRPDSSLSEWYERDIKPGWHRLRNLRVEIAEREAPPDGR